MSNRTVCSWALHWPRQRTLVAREQHDFMDHTICTSLGWKYKHFPLKHWDRVGEENCIFTNIRDRRMVTLSSERITITSRHAFSRVACKSTQDYVPSEKEGLISRKAAAHFWCPSWCRAPGSSRYEEGDIASSFTVAGPVRRELPAGWQCWRSGETGSKRGGYSRRADSGHSRTAKVFLQQEQTSGQAGETTGRKKLL